LSVTLISFSFAHPALQELLHCSITYISLLFGGFVKG